MRWQHPKRNDIRRRIKFAWFPTEVDDVDSDKSFTIWLEKYTSIERYDTWYDGMDTWDYWYEIKKEILVDGLQEKNSKS